MKSTYFQAYIRSFTDKRILHSLLIDILFVFLSVLISGWYFGTLQKKSIELSGGLSPELFQQALLAASRSDALLGQFQSFVLFFFIGGLILCLFLLFFYSLSRNYLWYVLSKKKFIVKKYWKWNLLTIVLGGHLLIYVPIILIFKMIFNQILVRISGVLQLTLQNIFLIAVLLIFLLFVFLVHHSFTSKHKVFESIGDAFHQIKLKWTNLWRTYLFIFFTAIIIGLISYLLQRQFLYSPQWINLIIGIGLFLLLLSWARVYFIRSIFYEHPQTHKK